MAIYWVQVQDSNNVVWYLGIVEDVDEHNAHVIHLKRSDRKGQNLILPENPEKLNVIEDQIIARNISVIYHGVSCRIELIKATLNEISMKVKEVQSNI